MPCLELWPAKACGAFGECVITNETTGFSTCLCDEGWSTSLELVFDNREDVSGTCDHNETFLLVIYSLMVVTSSILSLVYLYVIIFVLGSIKKAKRWTMPLLTHMLIVGAGVRRLTSPKTSLLLSDFLFTFLFANAYCLIHVTFVQFLDKYLRYLQRKLNFGDVTSIKERLQYVRKLNYRLTYFDLVVAQLFWVATLTDRNAALILIRLTMSLYVLRNIFLNLLQNFVFGRTSKDLLTFVEIQAEMAKNQEKTQFTIWAEKKAKQMASLRTTNLIIANVALLIVYLPAIFSDFGLQNLKYTLSTLILIFSLASVFGIRTSLLQANKAQRKTDSDYQTSVKNTGTSSNEKLGAPIIPMRSNISAPSATHDEPKSFSESTRVVKHSSFGVI